MKIFDRIKKFRFKSFKMIFTWKYFVSCYLIFILLVVILIRFAFYNNSLDQELINLYSNLSISDMYYMYAFVFVGVMVYIFSLIYILRFFIIYLYERNLRNE